MRTSNPKISVIVPVYNVENIIKRLGISNAHLEGSTKDVRSVYLNACFSVVSSRSEGFPMVVLEAIECGLPVVTFDCPYGPGDILTDGVDGYVVPMGNDELYEKRIIELMNDAEKRKRMGKNASEKAKKYDVNEVMASWQALYDNLIGTRK